MINDLTVCFYLVDSHTLRAQYCILDFTCRRGCHSVARFAALVEVEHNGTGSGRAGRNCSYSRMASCCSGHRLW